MKGYKYNQIMNPFFEMPTDYKELTKVYKTLAKTADQRLVRLESYSHDKEMGNVLQWAYARAQRDIEQWSGEGATRFNTAPPDSVQGLMAKIEDIKTFLSSESSTKQGIKNILQRRADTFNEKYGTNYKWDEVGEFFDSELYEDLNKKYGSDTMQTSIGVIQKNKKKILNAMEKNKDIFIKVPDDIVLQKTVNDILSEYGDDVKDFLQ